MKILSSQVESYIERSSWIRRMFEAGIELKAKYGEDAVSDFSLGNPDLPPPPAVAEALHEMADKAQEPFAFGYMPNFGYPQVRERLAEEISAEQGYKVSGEDVIITCGAAGALNAFFRAVLEPGDEIIVPAPYFVEYSFYAENHGGVLKPVRSKPMTFELDVEAIDQAITDKTRVVMVNSPNNPTGRIYTREELEDLAAVLTKHNAGRERPIFLLSDEPYRFLAFGGKEVPSLLPLYPFTVVCSSFSKNLALAGERIGYAVVNPAMPMNRDLMAGLILANRILGFVNAPAIAQKILLKALGSGVDSSIYARRRDLMADILDEAGYSYALPHGAFYFFPEAPGGDDVKFCALLQEEKILGVPGRGFGFPGYFRLAFCVGEDVISRAREGFARALRKAEKG